MIEALQHRLSGPVNAAIWIGVFFAILLIYVGSKYESGVFFFVGFLLLLASVAIAVKGYGFK